jgi:tetratricopeptide (TPR) repeat protein
MLSRHSLTIVERLQVALVAGQTRRLVKVATSNMQAYELYLKGRAMLYKRGLWIAQAQRSFEAAVTLDPGYAQAWAGLADVHTTLGYYGFIRSGETLPQALEAARRATELDPESAEAHTALAATALLWDRDFETAEREFLRALELNPHYMQARGWYALFLLQWTAGRLEEGVAQARRALDADPLSAYATLIHAITLVTARRYSEGLVQARLAIDRDPESFIACWTLGMVCQLNGRFEEALAAFETLMTQSDRHVWGVVGLAMTYAKMGKPAEARASYSELMARCAHQYVQPCMLAMAASSTGEHEAAIGFAHQAVDERDGLFALLALNYPDLDRLRADPRYAGMLVDLGFTAVARRK